MGGVRCLGLFHKKNRFFLDPFPKGACRILFSDFFRKRGDRGYPQNLQNYFHHKTWVGISSNIAPKKIPQKTRIFGPNILFLAPFHLFLPFWVHCRPDLMQKHNFLPFQVQCGGLFYLFLMGATLLFSSAPPNLGSESESPNPKPNFKKGRALNSSRCH